MHLFYYNLHIITIDRAIDMKRSSREIEKEGGGNKEREREGWRKRERERERERACVKTEGVLISYYLQGKSGVNSDIHKQTATVHFVIIILPIKMLAMYVHCIMYRLQFTHSMLVIYSFI